MNRPVRVLVVDDSAFVRKVLREVLTRDPAIEVVDIARDGLEALEKIQALKPDVITLDLVMPGLDGLGVLAALPRVGAPKVLVVSFSDADTEIGAQALLLGAADLVKKPTALATDQLYELSRPLLEKIRKLADAPGAPDSRAPLASVGRADERIQLVAIGTSTGGPQALQTLLGSLPADFPVPLVMALHIPAGYTGALAARLSSSSRIRVVEAEDGLILQPGVAVLARGGEHLEVVREGSGFVTRVPFDRGEDLYTPSVNRLFESASRAAGSGVLAAVLTGMGDDGARGAQAVHDRGGVVVTEARSSCVIYGMPRAVREAGLSSAEAPIERLGMLITEVVVNGPGALIAARS